MTPDPEIIKKRALAIERSFSLFDSINSVKGARIYEIGVDPAFVSAKHFIKLGASHVVCTNFSEIDLAPIEGMKNIEFHRIDASDATFEAESFDIVFGRSILEHVPNMKALAEEMYRLLKPGGVFFVDGGPMWTCKHGHHIWLNAPSGTLYNFSTNNPILPWEHLRGDYKRLQKDLVERGMPEDDAVKVIDFLENSRDINRATPTEVFVEFDKMDGFDCSSVRFISGNAPPTDIPNYSQNDLATGMLVVVGQKRTDAKVGNIFSKHVENIMKLRGGNDVLS